MARLIAIAACAALCAAAAGEHRARAAACPPNLANELASTRSATQLVTVVAASRRSTRGSLRLWRKSGDCWLAVDGPWSACLGGKGVSESRHEGDRSTPAGSFGFQRTMYGLGPNPGVR